MRTLRLRPETPTRLGDYDLDAVAIEIGADESELDFRFELGQGLGIYWALPAGRNQMIRLAHVDGAAYTLEEPILVEAPWRCDVPPLVWQGELAELPNGRVLASVRLEARAQPAAYRCELVTTHRGGAGELLVSFSWTEG